MITEPLTIDDSLVNQTLAAVVRSRSEGQSWTQVRQVIADRKVLIDGQVCTDPARRVKVGEVITQRTASVRVAVDAQPGRLNVRYLDDHLIVVEKPAGVSTVRHPSERDWSERRKALTPTLEELIPLAIERETRLPKHKQYRLRCVHRLDKETSGLVVFARGHTAQVELGRQFKDHSITRRYLTLIHGFLKPQRLESTLIRDRGDGRRGSSESASASGKHAVTHVDVVERIRAFTLLSCRLETGRTHQIRIHLSEAGFPVCGDRVYSISPTGETRPDPSASPRLMLHACELGLTHPISKQRLRWEMEPPADFQQVLARLREKPLR